VKRIAVFGSLDDPQVSRVISLATRRGHHVIQIAPEGWIGDGREPHSIYVGSDGKWRAEFGLEDPLDVDSAWVRHLPPPFPTIDTREGLPPLERLDVFQFAMHARERASAVLSVVDALLALKKKVINPPSRGLGIQNKPTQLLRMTKAKVRVPDTLITDDREAVKDFARGRTVIFRPVTGDVPARVLDEAEHGVLEQLAKSPLIFQEVVAGDDARVTMVGDQVVSSVAVDASGKYREVELPPKVARALDDARRALELTFVGFDVRFDPARPEAYAVLEANPSPTYLEVELTMGHGISDALIDALETDA
jgi:glutathione synthase/RimK-type ligase-like ATP-grasp enzyme